MLWLYQGDAEAGAYFTDGAAASAGWTDAVSQNIDSSTVPIGDGAAASAPGAGNATSAVVNSARDCTVEYVRV
jgi:hypothetical protein